MKQLILSIGCVLALGTSAFAQREAVLLRDNEPRKDGPLAYRVVQHEVRMDHHVTFVPGKAELLPESVPALQTIKKYLEEKPTVSLLRIESHEGCGAEAQTLSEQRAKAISDWLVKQGVDCKRLVPVGFGCNKPIHDEFGDVHGRITFVNAALRGHPIDGMPIDGGGKVAGDACGK